MQAIPQSSGQSPSALWPAWLPHSVPSTEVLSLTTSGPRSPWLSPGSAPHDFGGHRLLPPGMSGPLLGSILYPGLCVCDPAKKDAPLSN